MAGRFKDSAVSDEIASLVRQDPGKAADVPEALDYFLGSSVGTKTRSQLRVKLVQCFRTLWSRADRTSASTLSTGLLYHLLQPCATSYQRLIPNRW